MSVTLPIDASLAMGNVEYFGKLVKAGTRNFHPQSAYEGRRKFDVAKEPSADGWYDWYVFESQMPLPKDLEDMPKLSYASWMDVDRDDCEAPGQLYRRRAYIRRMGMWKMLITQEGGRDI